MPDLHFDATMGAAGDMILAALIDAGADEDSVRGCIAAVAPEAVLSFDTTTRCGLRARRALVSQVEPGGARTWASIRADLTAADVPERVRRRCLAAFQALAEAEAHVHGTDVESVHFHEVGALDSIVDVVGGCAALESLRPGSITCSPVATGSGYARTQHGRIPLPTPALVAVLSGTGARLTTGPADFEACTPTAAALLATWTHQWTRGPELKVERVGVGAGAAAPSDHPNVTRVMIGHASPLLATAGAGHAATTGTAAASAAGPQHTHGDGAVLLETNIDDMDPRLWPEVIERLLEAGASDAWLSPILMKKGRPAHTLHVLCRADRVEELTQEVLRQTTAIGLRVVPCGKAAAQREMATIKVAGQPIRVKVASWNGAVVNIQPEWEDVKVAARATGLPAKLLLSQAQKGAAGLRSPSGQADPN